MLRNVRTRINAADPEVFRYFLWVVGWCGVLPYGIYAAAEAIWLGGPPSVGDLTGEGQLWVVAISMLLGTYVILSDSKRLSDQWHQLIQPVVIAMLCFAVLPWCYLTVRAIQHAPLEAWQYFWAVGGLAYISIVVILGHEGVTT